MRLLDLFCLHGFYYIFFLPTQTKSSSFLNPFILSLLLGYFLGLEYLVSPLTARTFETSYPHPYSSETMSVNLSNSALCKS